MFILTKHGMQSITAGKNDTIQGADSKHFKVEFIRDQVILSAYHFSSMIKLYYLLIISAA